MTCPSLLQRFPQLKPTKCIRPPTRTLYSLLSAQPQEWLCSPKLRIRLTSTGESFTLGKYEPTKAGLMGRIWLTPQPKKENAHDYQIADIDAIGERWSVEMEE